MFYDLTFLIPMSLLLLRIIVGIIFFSSGWSHAKKPVERGKSIGMPPAAAATLGVIEVIAAISIGVGIYAQIGGLLIIFTMLGAMYKKIFEWKKKFYEH